MDNTDLMATLGHLTSAVGHHIINSFSTIVSQAEILRLTFSQDKGLSEDAAERIDIIIRTSLDASRSTRLLIDLSHEASLAHTEMAHDPQTAVQFDRLVSDYVAAEGRALGPSVDWVLDLHPVPPILGRAGLLRTMLRLFLENSVESLAGGAGTIKISSHTNPRGWLVLEIQDSGCGMTDEVMERAAEPFFTTKPERRGIGLTVARGIWRRHRGTLTIESEVGAGTSIRLSAAPASVP